MTEPNIKYLVEKYSAKIRAYACSKEDANYVWLDNYWRVGNTQQLKRESQVFDTWAEAHAELARRAEEKLNQARLQLQQAQGFAGNVRGMKEPTND